jgi:putative transposase
LYGRAKEALAAFPKLCTGVTLHRRDGQWYATVVVERRAAKVKAHTVIGVDIGMATIVATSAGNRYGHITLELRQRVERSTAKRRRKQKLNACLKRKGLPTVDLADGQTEAFTRNAIGCALNHMLDELPTDAAIAVERSTVQEMRLKSRQMNRALRASQLGYVRDKLTFKLDERGIRYRRVQAAYSSQECAMCGFVHKGNRPSQAAFTCLRCGHTENADVNAARNIAKRFGDDELNQLHFRDVKAVLQERFARRLSPDARSASAGLDTSPGTSGGESYKKSIGPVQTSVS